MRYTALIFIVLLAAGCTKPSSPTDSESMEQVFQFQGEEDLRTLTLRHDGSFVWAVDLGYYSRVDSGRYVFHGDTLLLNPDRRAVAIDSVVIVSMADEPRILEAWIEEYESAGDTVISTYRPQLYPKVVINNSDTLNLVEDGTYRRLEIPGDARVASVQVYITDHETCPPGRWLTYTLDPVVNGSLRVYIPSIQRNPYYLAQARWIVTGDTVYCRFLNDQCMPSETRLIRSKEPV